MKYFNINAVWLVPFLYFTIAMIEVKVNIKGEIFPFYHWGLYSKVPQSIVYNELYVIDTIVGEVKLYTKVSDKVNRVTYCNILEGFVNHIGTEQENEYLHQILVYIPEGKKVILKQKENNNVKVLGEIENHIFKVSQ